MQLGRARVKQLKITGKERLALRMRIQSLQSNLQVAGRPPVVVMENRRVGMPIDHRQRASVSQTIQFQLLKQVQNRQIGKLTTDLL